MQLLSAKHGLKLALAAAALLLGTACTQVNEDNDPWEPLNRGLYQTHVVIDGVILKPITQVYRGVMPEQGQEMVHNFVLNLQEPISFGNSVLQADPQNSFVTLWRFLINSTFGIGGLFDVATDIGLKGRTTGFGDTLALYGVEDGPYLFIPILGPSGARDGLGRVADAFMHPAMYVNDTGTSIALWSVTAVDTRNHYYDIIEDINKTSLDPYVTFRSAYKQRRANDVKKARAARNAAWEKAKACE